MKQVRPKKNLGQHFLTDLSIAKRIADTVDACPELPVLEVGPGMGVLTQYLMEKPRPLKVVEIDSESVAYLKELFSWNEESNTRNVESNTRNVEGGMRNEESKTWNVECGMRNENSSAAESVADDGNLLPHSTFHLPQNPHSGNLLPPSTFHLPQNPHSGNLLPHSTFHLHKIPTQVISFHIPHSTFHKIPAQ